LVSTEIIEKCKRNEQRAYKQCYEACAPYVYAIVKNYINEDERKDAMQVVFAQIFSSLHNYDARKGAFKSWISQVTVYQCIGILRKRKKLNLFVPFDDSHKLVSTDEEKLLTQMSSEDLNNFLSEMPTGYKTVFMLNIIDGYTHKEIAKLLDISAETSRSQLSRAIGWIRKNLLEATKNLVYG
jgi:RNA polymerase sigma-70 factor (ECF subfamily)